MASTIPDFKKTAKVSPTKRLVLTQDDTKVLGNYERKLEKTLPPSKFKTSMYKTHKSNWTPIVNKPSNEQVFDTIDRLWQSYIDLILIL